MLKVTEQRPINNAWLAFLNFTANFYQRCKQETMRSIVKCFCAPFSLEWQKELLVKEFSVERQLAITSWEDYLIT